MILKLVGPKLPRVKGQEMETSIHYRVPRAWRWCARIHWWRMSRENSRYIDDLRIGSPETSISKSAKKWRHQRIIGRHFDDDWVGKPLDLDLEEDAQTPHCDGWVEHPRNNIVMESWYHAIIVTNGIGFKKRNRQERRERETWWETQARIERGEKMP